MEMAFNLPGKEDIDLIAEFPWPYPADGITA